MKYSKIITLNEKFGIKQVSGKTLYPKDFSCPISYILFVITQKKIDVGRSNKYMPTYGESLLSVKRVVNAIARLINANPNKITEPKRTVLLVAINSGAWQPLETPQLTKRAEITQNTA